MKVLLETINRYWLNILTGSVLSTVSGICIVFIIRIINKYLQNKFESFDVIDFILEFGALLIPSIVTSIIATKMLSRISNKIVLDLRSVLAKKILEAPFQTIEFKKEKLMGVMVNDIQTIARTTDKIPGIIVRLATTIGGVIYLFTISVTLSAIVLGLFLIVYVTILITNQQLKEISKKARKSWYAIYARFNELIYGLKELQLSADHQLGYLEKSLPESNKEEYEQKVKERVNVEVTSKISEGILFVGVGVIIVLINRVDFLESSVFIEFLTVTLFILSPLSTIASFTKSLSPFRASLNEIENLGLFLEYSSPNEIAPEELTHGLQNEITLKEVSYKYFNNEVDDFFQLGPLSLKIPAGKITMIIGSNGSGKTTLGKIIAGLYQPQSGEVEFDQALIKDDHIQFYRNNFGAVFTDNFLFTDLRYIKNLNLELAQHYLKIFQLDHKVSILDSKFSNNELSIGQQKRLALIVALLEDRDIYLFDEWPANQDPQFKRVFYFEILKELKNRGKTIILITHDDKYFECADYLFKISEGKLVS